MFLQNTGLDYLIDKREWEIDNYNYQLFLTSPCYPKSTSSLIQVKLIIQSNNIKHMWRCDAKPIVSNYNLFDFNIKFDHLSYLNFFCKHLPSHLERKCKYGAANARVARWQGCSVERLPPAFERCSARVRIREQCSLI